ncbi:MAG: PhoU domain-containing protein, partial [Clostridium paraputrificum]
GNVARQVANAHTIFNISVTIVLLPLAKYLVLLANKLLPGDEIIEKDGAIYLDKNLLETPVVASSQVFKETIRMGEIAKKNIEAAMDAFLNNNEKNIEQVYRREKIINNLEREITDYLVDLSSYDLPVTDSKNLSATFHVINDIERIGDHAENIVELATDKINNNISIGTDAKNELIAMYEKTLEALTLAIESYKNEDNIEALNIKKIEESIDKYEKDLRENNIRRLNEHSCSANSSTIFLDLISNLERIGDHSNNIAAAVRER